MDKVHVTDSHVNKTFQWSQAKALTHWLVRSSIIVFRHTHLEESSNNHAAVIIVTSIATADRASNDENRRDDPEMALSINTGSGDEEETRNTHAEQVVAR